MSNVYMDNGTAVQVLRFDMAVTVHDYQSNETLWSGDVPQHLSEHYSSAEAAEWATQWVDAVYGLPVTPEPTEDPHGVIEFGMLGHSYVEHFRAGARYGISVTVAGKGKGFTLSDRNGDVTTFLTESEVIEFARYTPGCTLGTTEVTL